MKFGKQFANQINFHLYHYAGNNPVRYLDPDGNAVWFAISMIIGLSMIFKSDRQPIPNPVNVDAINNKLANIYYDDPAIRNGPIITNPNTKENTKSIKLEQHPLLAISAALPRGSYSESDYSDPNQIKGSPIVKTGTVLDGLSLLSNVIENLSEGHLGDVILTYKKSNGKIMSWNMTLTTFNPETGKATGRQIFSREDALKYLNDNKEVLKNDPAYKELQNLLD